MLPLLEGGTLSPGLGAVCGVVIVVGLLLLVIDSPAMTTGLLAMDANEANAACADVGVGRMEEEESFGVTPPAAAAVGVAGTGGDGCGSTTCC